MYLGYHLRCPNKGKDYNSELLADLEPILALLLYIYIYIYIHISICVIVVFSFREEEVLYSLDMKDVPHGHHICDFSLTKNNPCIACSYVYVTLA
jgi:hypothetical protein